MKISKDHSVAFAWFGMIGVAAFIIAWVCAASIDTAWEFGVNKLSEFGISDTDASLYFNYGCMITGALVAVFGVGCAVYAKNMGRAVGGALLVLGGVALALVGVYTMNDGDLHSFAAVSAALLIFLAMIAFAAGNWIADKKIFAGIGIVLIFLLATMALVFDVAELEAYGIILVMMWFLAESVNMVLSSRKG
ncbi:MAG: DUF998 domain-containing protein [Methanomassiliicoccaceae archaeon]|nr:DUF998 domain-containing protein [Methanomassiliicoccaceae archaeon]MCL2145626.1 DUF998 domain-containing protein [Methanomassiliicoccaceae archaeon]